MIQLSVTKKISIIVLLLSISIITDAQISVNTTGSTANSSAMLDVSSTDKGMLIPRMTSVQRTSIANPSVGLLVFDTSTNSFWYYSGDASTWQKVGNSVAGATELNELSDTKYDGSSLFIGDESGAHDDASSNGNTAIGKRSLSLNTSGASNTAIGYYTMEGNSTGSSNTAVGLMASRENTIGSNNTALGYQSNFFNQNGYDNTILGYQAGRGTSLHSKSGNIFLGYQAGYNEISDNKLYIENSNSSAPLIGGDFANDSLFFNGVVRITGGNPGVNKILTSDVDGNATWEVNTAASELNELSDAIYDGSSLFIGEGAGVDDDHTINHNTAVGSFSFYKNTSGYNNTAIGTTSLVDNISGFENIAIGFNSLGQNVTGWRNTVVGNSALLFNTNGTNNISFGFQANYYNQSGDCNTIIGTEAGRGSSVHSKNGNIFLGYQAGYNETGSNKLYIENSNSSSPLIGGDFANDSLFFNGVVRITGGNPGVNKILTSDVNGNATWEVNTAASELNELSDAKYDGTSLFIGEGAGATDDATANNNTAFGKNALTSNTSGIYNSANGNSSLYSNTTGSNNTANGAASLQSNTTGNGNTGSGFCSLYSNTTGSVNTAYGFQSLYSNSTGAVNTSNGYQSLYSNTNGGSNTASGYQSLYFNTIGSNNTAVGVNAAYESIEGDNNISFGSYSNYYNQNGNNNTIIGTDAGKGNSVHSKSGSVFLGFQAGYNETGSNKLYIENSNSSSPLIGGDFANDSLFFNAVVRITGGNPGANKLLTSDAAGNATWEVNAAASELNELSDAIYDGSSLFIGEGAGATDDASANNNTAIGKSALTSNTTGHNNTANGYQSLKSNSTGVYNTAIGSKTLQNNTASDNTAFGYDALNANTSGGRNVAVGVIALKLNTTGQKNVAVGYAALKSLQSGNYNSAFGTNSLINTTGERNTGSGYNSLNENTSGGYNTAFGYESGHNNTTGIYNTFLGYNARVNNTTAKSNSTAVGNDAIITASNQVRIGNTSVTSIGGYEPWTDLSDKRFKTNISEDITGLNFIMALRPVSYNLDIQKLNDFLGVDRKSVDMKAVAKKSSTRQSGFIAQEVEQAAQAVGFDFSGVDVPEDKNDHYGLRYSQFVVPLVKAAQEQQEMIIKLQKEIEELKSSIKKLTK